MGDDGKDITAPANEMTLTALKAKQDKNAGRFEFFPSEFGGYADCSWVNYYRTASGKRSKDENGAYKLLERQYKVVKVI